MTASARPQRLQNLAETTGGIADGLATRAGWIDDAWITYSGRNGIDWRFDFGDLPDALRAWARTLRAIGEFTGAVGAAFLAADDDDADGRHVLSEAGLRRQLPRDVRAVLDAGGTGDADGTDEVFDWGAPDDPPAWLDALDFSATVVGDVGPGVDLAEVSYVIGSGRGARWAPETPAALGRFATPVGLQQFAQLFTVGSSVLSGAATGLGQREQDAATLNYTDGELAARSVAATGVAGAGALATSVGGAALAGVACGPGAPVCAGVVIVAVGLGGARATEGMVGLLVPAPDPADHDPAVVADRVDSVAPDTLLRDVPAATWDVIEAVEHAGADAGESAFEAHHPYLDSDAVLTDPSLITAHDLPAPWVRSQVLRSLVAG